MPVVARPIRIAAVVLAALAFAGCAEEPVRKPPCSYVDPASVERAFGISGTDVSESPVWCRMEAEGFRFQVSVKLYDGGSLLPNGDGGYRVTAVDGVGDEAHLLADEDYQLIVARRADLFFSVSVSRDAGLTDDGGTLTDFAKRVDAQLV